MNLPLFIYSRTRDALCRFFGTRSQKTMPAQVGDYTLEKPLKYKPYNVGIYADAHGNKVIIKTIERSVSEVGYHYMRNEILLYRLIDAAQKTVPLLHVHAHVPQYISSEIHPLYTTLIIKYIPSTNLRLVPGTILSAEKKVEMYFAAVKMLQELYRNIPTKDRSKIPHHTLLHTTLVLACTSISAIVLHPRLTRDVLAGLRMYTKLFWVLFKDRAKIAFIHKDLHFKNILVTPEQESYLIDFEECMIGHPIHQYAISLGLEWHRGRNVPKVLHHKILEHLTSYPNGKKILAAYMIAYGIHRLGDKLELSLEHHYRSYLRYALELGAQS